MYQDMAILSVDSFLDDKKILVSTNFDIDPKSVDISTFVLFNKQYSSEVLLKFNVIGKIIEAYIEDEIIPNSQYILRVSNIRNVLGEVLSSGITKSLIFKSIVTEKLEIVSPSEYEMIKDLTVKLNIVPDNNIPTDGFFYRVQISKDMAFIDIKIDNVYINKDIIFQSIENSQYFIRARIEKLQEVGQWSKTVSFVVNSNVIDNNDDTTNEPIYFEEIKLIDSPMNGITPEKILLEFSGDIYPYNIDSIIITRRDI